MKGQVGGAPEVFYIAAFTRFYTPDAPVFRAKNVPPDHLQLRVPVWVSDLCFPDASRPDLAAAANRHGHVRLYDARLDGRRRPVREASFDGETLTAMSATNNSAQVIEAVELFC